MTIPAGYFSRTFAAATGLTPTAWREANLWKRGDGSAPSYS